VTAVNIDALVRDTRRGVPTLVRDWRFSVAAVVIVAALSPLAARRRGGRWPEPNTLASALEQAHAR
jgi:hypothetical protein